VSLELCRSQISLSVDDAIAIALARQRSKSPTRTNMHLRRVAVSDHGAAATHDTSTRWVLQNTRDFGVGRQTSLTAAGGVGMEKLMRSLATQLHGTLEREPHDRQQGGHELRDIDRRRGIETSSRH
jgi:hypothetical protein